MRIYLEQDDRDTVIREHPASGVPSDKVRDIDALTLARWRKSMAQFDAVQKEMLKAIEEGA